MALQQTTFTVYPDSTMLNTDSIVSPVFVAVHDTTDSLTPKHSTFETDERNNTLLRFFTEARTHPIRFEPQPIINQQNDWQLLTLTISMLIIAFVRISGKNFFRNMRLAFGSRPIFKQLFRDGMLFPLGAIFPLFIAYLLVITTLIFQADAVFSFLKFNSESSPYFRIIEPGILIGVYFLIKNIVINVVGSIFKTKNIDKEYLYNSAFFNTVTAIALIPLLFFSVYAVNSTLLWIALFITFSLYFFRIFRGLQIAFEARRYSQYQILLYLCALEILPLITIFKVLID